MGFPDEIITGFHSKSYVDLEYATNGMHLPPRSELNDEKKKKLEWIRVGMRSMCFRNLLHFFFVWLVFFLYLLYEYFEWIVIWEEIFFAKLTTPGILCWCEIISNVAVLNFQIWKTPNFNSWTCPWLIYLSLSLSLCLSVLLAIYQSIYLWSEWYL